MFISVIIVTRNRSDSIGETLEALRRQTHSDFELIIVDSSDIEIERGKTGDLGRKYGGKIILQPRRGVSLARNTGIANSSGDLIVFIDDDCIPENDWLKQTIENFSNPSIWGCTSRIMPFNRNAVANFFEEVAGQDLGPVKRIFNQADVQFSFKIIMANLGKIFAKHLKSKGLAPWCIGHGSSMTFRREIFEQTGAFDERFGGGAPGKGCEDIEILYRTLRAGHSVVYEPLAVVRHKQRLTSDNNSSSLVRRQSEATFDEVYNTRYVYSFAGAAFMREFRDNLLIRFMFYGRFTQLVIKMLQYKLTNQKQLAQSFASDFRGFCDGIKAQKKFPKIR
jgi:glycosyltransferase involved in cell wall biosynthesis